MVLNSLKDLVLQIDGLILCPSRRMFTFLIALNILYLQSHNEYKDSDRWRWSALINIKEVV